MAEIAGILETTLYYPGARREEVLGFYDDVLGLRRVAEWPDGTAYRAGGGVLLLFDRERLAGRDDPTAAHGADGPGHVCLRAGGGDYEALRARLVGAGVEITHDHSWPRGRSFYFADPAGNLLEVADSNIWPE